MSEPHLIRQFAGLFGSTNPYAVAPEGALERADNCVIRSQEVLSSRRGYQSFWGVAVSAIGWKDGYMVLLGWDDVAHGLTGRLDAVQGLVPDPNNGPSTPASWAQLPMNPGGFPFASPGGANVFTRFISANKSLYFQSRYGLTKVESIAPGLNVIGASRSALQPPLAADGFLAGTADDGVANPWLQNNSQVAYRFTTAARGPTRSCSSRNPPTGSSSPTPSAMRPAWTSRSAAAT